MSIVVAVHKGNHVVLACDSQQTMGSILPGKDNLLGSKIRRIGKAYLACTGWGLYHNIFDDFLKGKKNIALDSSGAIFEFFLELWSQLHKKYSFVNDQCENRATPFGDLDSTFLIASQAGLFCVSANMSVMELAKYQAIGSGAEVALGAIHALYDMNLSPEEIARKAIRAAMDHNIYCGGDIEIRRIANQGGS
jgi:ATP-dependent HslUV protease, peptidase subunit HslV